MGFPINHTKSDTTKQELVFEKLKITTEIWQYNVRFSNSFWQLSFNKLISNILNSESLLNSNSGSNLYSTYKLIRIETPFKTKYGTILFLYNIHYFLSTGKIIGNNQWKSNSLSCKTIRCRKITMQNCIYFTEFVQKKMRSRRYMNEKLPIQRQT